MTLVLPGRLVLVGGGKMGTALLEGWLDEGLDPATVTVFEPMPGEALSALASQYGFALQTSPVSVAGVALIVLAVKPQVMDDVVPEYASLAGPDTVVLSIAAGRTIASIARLFPGAAKEGTVPVVRAMPNTPAAIRRGMTVLCPGAGVGEAARDQCEALLGAVGEVAWVEDEALMDAVTAVSGSGPAYVFHLIETMAAAGEEAGLEAGLSLKLARATVAGAGALAMQSDDTPARLRENVTSPGGTTAAALEVLMSDDGLAELMRRAVDAAKRRSRELSG